LLSEKSVFSSVFVQNFNASQNLLSVCSIEIKCIFAMLSDRRGYFRKCLLKCFHLSE